VTVWVIRDGKLVDKATLYRHQPVSGFPTPRISRFEAFESPVTGNEVTSWRQRDREMAEHDCYDPRDLKHNEVRANADRTGPDDDTFEWID
jgi:hypothetical protein